MDFARRAVRRITDGPLDVLRSTEVLLDQPRELGHGEHVVVAQARSIGSLRIEGPLAETVGEHDDLALLGRDGAADDLVAVLVDDEVIRCHHPGDDRLPEPEGAVDDDAAAVAREGVDGEGDAGGGRQHHQLDDHRHGRIGDVEPAGQAMVDRSRGEQTRPAPHHVMDDVVLAPDPQRGLLEPGTARVLEILDRRTRPDRDGHRCPVCGTTERSVGRANRLVHRCARPLVEHEASSGTSRGAERRQIRGVEVDEQLTHRLTEAVARHRRSEVRDRQHEAERHAEAGAPQFREVRALGPDQLQVECVVVVEPDRRHGNLSPRDRIATERRRATADRPCPLPPATVGQRCR